MFAPNRLPPVAGCGWAVTGLFPNKPPAPVCCVDAPPNKEGVDCAGAGVAAAALDAVLEPKRLGVAAVVVVGCAEAAPKRDPAAGAAVVVLALLEPLSIRESVI